MSAAIVEGPKNNWEDDPVSLGKIFYDALSKGDPDKVIMVDETTGEQITNQNLLDASISLARYLKRIGLTKADTISVVSGNTWKYSAVVTAGLFLGIPVNGVNPGYVEDEITKCFAIVQPRILFANTNCLKPLEGYMEKNDHQIHEIILMEDIHDDHHKTINNIIDNNKSDEPFAPEDLDAKETVALILFSSGTCGLPKATLLTHHNLRNSVNYLIDPIYLAQDHTTITIILMPMFHVFGMLLMFSSVLCQTKSIILTSFKPEIYLNIIEKYKVTHLYVVPMLMVFLAKTPLLDKYKIDSVTNIACGAAPVGREVEKIVEQRFPNANIKQMYGLTETSGVVTVTTGLIGRTKEGSAGVPAYGMTIKIVNPKTGITLKRGEVGEICVKSVANMKGYLKNEKESREAFNDDGFLKSGDLGYIDDDGVLFIVDRLKEVIKYKGFQVSPAELEDLLRKYTGVADAAVVGRPDDKAGEVPVAFVIKQPQSDIHEEDLVNHISEHVSREKRLYGGVIFVDELPRNPTGKVLKRILKEQLKAN